MNIKARLTSRKFLVAVAGIVSGIVLLIDGCITEGTTMIATSVVAYLAAEGLIDMAALKQATDAFEE